MMVAISEFGKLLSLADLANKFDNTAKSAVDVLIAAFEARSGRRGDRHERSLC